MEGGGDYWVSCVSAISNAFKRNDKSLLNEKVLDIYEKLPHATANITKTQYQRNIDVLESFEDFDLDNVKPSSKIQILRKLKEQSIIEIDGLSIEVKPTHVFSFSEKGSDEIGAIWFVAKLNGYDINELGMFTDILYRYLDKYFSDKYYINKSFCIAVDVVSGREVRYTSLEDGSVRMLLEETITQINKL
ncbi:hypothetical protein [Algoriphagus sp. NG3]|uniref:hypothetical protein n=1 Tax=Algoriphagus sp. NG3 TaxID=3097546 RepID=UPI002A7EBD50|nr:hypothetical protein [Algoriphagus sp. NG3]WPR76018.1 hypothetical protein SLW71_01480 [Algoriphagus sp. NG3]